MNNTNELSVALLMDDLEAAREVSQVFRLVGVIPHLFQSLEEFWKGVMDGTCSLAVVDVKSMNQGNLLFKDHPMVRSGKIAVSFWYTESTQALTYSTFDIPNLGLIRKGVSLKGQIKSALRIFNEQNKLRTENRALKIDSEKFDRQIDQLIERVEHDKQVAAYQEKLLSLEERIDTLKKSVDFNTAIEALADEWDDVGEFATFELSSTGQKLVSPKLGGRKFREIPSLWLGKTCARGIEFFAQNMASQVTLDLMGGDIMALAVRGIYENPDRLVFFKVKNDEFMNMFAWDALERALSGLHLYFEQRDRGESLREDGVISPWDLLGKLDDYLFGVNPAQAARGNGNKEKLALIDLDFSDLVETVRRYKTVRFQWPNFYRDFFAKLKQTKLNNFTVTAMGVSHVGLLVDHEGLDATLKTIQAFSGRFPYWKYFEDVDLVLGQSLKPRVKMVPLSSLGYLNQIDQARLDTGILENAARTNAKPEVDNTIVVPAQSRPWRSAPHQDM
ncbi:MAG: hypothetical protein CME71_08950 [Halobacteriovorax sp.]|nr:hypothetical protein [Halobacteriovorax sp.]